ncbi:MAG TPA: rhamnogalacturonan acetylesterase [Gemmatimonadaceae bacterium]|nr:rhamnogalacturonan acetylesterase [Gemmatimonadaceae bacterium]
MRLPALALALLPLSIGAPVTVHLAGDSTMATKRADRRPETGWGELLPHHLDSTRAVVRNHAANGRSTRSFIAEGRWQALVDSLRPGDWVLVQFGHNDESPAKGDRYAPPPEFTRNLRRFVDDVRARRATPVLLTPVVRRRFAGDGTLVDTHGEYPDLVRAVAAERGVVLVDAERDTRAIVQRLGPDSSRALFLHLAPGAHVNYPQGVADDTHFNERGAAAVAELVVRRLRESRQPIADFLAGARPRVQKR